MRSVWLIRHAESEANAGLPTANPSHIGITARGSAQAALAAKALHHAPELVVTSPYLRTARTAAPMLARFGPLPQEEWPVEEFTYLSPERCGTSTTQQRRPMVDEYWARADPAFVDGPGAESFRTLLTRASGLVQRLATRREPFTVVYTHGQFIRAVLWTTLFGGSVHAGGDEMRRFRQFATAVEVPNTSITRLTLDGAGCAVGGVDVSHLPEELVTP